MIGRRPVLVAPVIPENIIRVVVNFANNPTYASSSFAQLKANKDVAIRLEFDDGKDTVYTNVFKKLNGGTAANGVTYTPMTYSDGCGKLINYKAGAAVFSKNGAPYLADLHNGTPNYVTWTQIGEMVRAGWALINHQYGADKLENRMYQIHENTKYFYTKMLLQGLQYRANAFVIPSADEGFTSTAFQLGLLIVSSQAGLTPLKDGFTALPVPALASDIEAQGNNIFLARYNLADDMSTTEAFKTAVTNALANSTGSNKYVLGAFSHGPRGDAPMNGFVSLIDDLHALADDRMWVANTQEIAEYFHTKRDITKTKQVLSGNRLVLEFDTNSVNPHTRCMDLSLLLDTDEVIESVSVINADDVTFNPTTKLINVYKERTVFADPSLDVVPPIITSIAISGSDAKVLNITYDRAVSQTLAAAYSVESNNVTGLSGSGVNWSITCGSDIISGKKFYYRMQNGDAVDVGNSALKVCSFIDWVIV